MTQEGHGGARPGAGRKPKFENRATLHAYIEERDKQTFLSMIEFLKEKRNDPGISMSNILSEYAYKWMRAIHEGEYLDWAGHNLDWLRDSYPEEHQRVVEIIEGKRDDGEKEPGAGAAFRDGSLPG